MPSGVVGDILTGIGNEILGGLTSRTYLRDWSHAAKTFLPGAQGNAPKVKFMFHTYFNINEDAWYPPTGKNYGLLVREIKLPSFKFNTDELNQYNRKRIIQTKIKYDPINVTFHDDNMSQITAMWNAYYQYYYADSWNPSVIPFATQPGLKNYNRRNIYDASITGDQEYGYRGGSTSNTNSGDPNFGTKIPFFKDITVYGIWANNFIAYTLINPIITNFQHDTYSYNEGGGTMTNQMTIDYETVVYNTGAIDPENPEELVTGFRNDANYDNSESPLAQGGSGIFDVLGSLGSGMESMQNGDVLGGINQVGTVVGDILRNPDSIVNTAVNQVTQGVTNAITDAIFGGPQTNATANSPTNGSTPSMVNIANQGVTTGANNSRTTVGGTPTAGGQVTNLQQATERTVTNVIDSIFGG